MRKSLLLSYDLLWVGISPFLALMLRHNLDFPIQQGYYLLPYAGWLMAIAAVVFVIAGLHRHLWHAATFSDLLRIMIAVSVVLAIALVFTFTINRLEGVARSVPIIQWFLMVGGIAAGRVVARFIRERKAGRQAGNSPPYAKRHVLVVGVNRLAQLYIRSIEALGSQALIRIEGVLTEDKQLQGRTLYACPVLGAPGEVAGVVNQFLVHGVIIERIVLAEPLEALSATSRDAILELERTSDVKLDFLAERLVDGELAAMISCEDDAHPPCQPYSEVRSEQVSQSDMPSTGSRGRRAKRTLDIALSAVLIVMLAPLALLVALVAAWDVGRPVLFWQQRPGRFGVPFRLYKFRTMRGAHDRQGRRIPDEQRTSAVGAFLRRVRLDEFPQLFNILFGQMSFVGPRPLLPVDQPKNADLRLQVRPGLTGWAQVSGGRMLDVDPELKSALDVWYARNMSLHLDLEILLRTFGVLVLGERVRKQAVELALASQRSGDRQHQPVLKQGAQTPRVAEEDGRGAASSQQAA